MSDHIARRLHDGRPKRILSLDGGGTRGIVSIAFLERIEKMLADRFVEQGLYDDPAKFRLAHYFDLIGGTSVGALIAAQLALAHSVTEIRDRFQLWMPEIFKRRIAAVKGFTDLYHAQNLSQKIEGLVRDWTMDSPLLKTGFAVVAKRADTGSVWVMTNNDRCKYWNREGDRMPNAKFKIHDVLRASSAAPTFFRPTNIEIFSGVDGNKPFTKTGSFIDGAVSPHNNPSLQLFKLTRLNGYGLNWATGPERLLMISIGTGTHATEVKKSRVLALEATDALLGMIGDSQQLVLAVMQWLSYPRDPWEIDREIGSQSEDLLTNEPLLSFQRYDMPLEPRWLYDNDPRMTGRRRGPKLKEALHEARFKRSLADLQELIAPKSVPVLYDLAAAAAEDQVSPLDFPADFDGHIWVDDHGPQTGRKST